MSRFIRIAVKVVSTVLALAVSPHVLAQAHSDIEASVTGGKLVVDAANSAPVAFATGYKLFEGDFGDLYGGPLKTDDPGFVVPDGTFLPGQQLGYQATGVLSFWNGAVWGTAPDNISLQLEDALGSHTVITAVGITSPSGIIDAADSGGGVHSHIDFSVSDLNPAGSYLATLQLTSRDASGNLPSPYLDSDPFHIVFNNGLSSGEFETSVTALMVPEPQTYAMLLAGLAVIGCMARRCREVTL